MKTNYLFYFCDDIGSVFDSQVLALLKAINDRSFFKKICLFLSIRNEKRKLEFFDREASSGIEIVFFKSYPNYPFFNYLNRKGIQKALYNQRIDLEEVIFHTRGELLAWHLSQVVCNGNHKNIIPDVRGASSEEIEEYYNINKFIKALKVKNYKKACENLKTFNKISAVSNSLKEYLVTNYDINSERIVITPCLASEKFRFNLSSREIIRKEFNLLREDILIAFSSGGTANWQNTDILIMLAEKGFKILNLSKIVISHKNIFNKFVNYSEMPFYLNSADAAIVWRDKSTVNKVASPVKFSEYICCGLPVIANYSVDTISEYIINHDCGVLIENFDEIEMRALKNLMKKDRKRISESGILHFGIDSIVDHYLQTYSSINNF